MAGERFFQSVQNPQRISDEFFFCRGKIEDEKSIRIRTVYVNRAYLSLVGLPEKHPRPIYGEVRKGRVVTIYVQVRTC